MPEGDVGGLVQVALNAGLNWISQEGGPIVPFIVTVDDEGERDVRSFLSDEVDISIRRARKAAAERTEAVQAWAVVFNGVVTMPGGPFDAVVADVAARDWSGPHRWLQRYQRKEGAPAIELVGKPLYAGPVPA